MAEEESFDPKTWGAPSPKEPVAGGPTRPGELPELFAGVADTRTSQTAPTVARRPAGNANAAPWTPLAGAALILLAGLGFAVVDPSARHAGKGGPNAEVSAADGAPASATMLAGDEKLAKRTLLLASAADLAGALRAAGLPAEEVGAATSAAANALGSAPGEIRATLQFRQKGSSAHFVRLDVSRPDGSGASVSADHGGAISGRAVAAELSRQIRVIRGELDANSFYSSAVTAGLTDTLIPEFVNAFSFDFNLASEVNPGDTFEVAYEQSVDASGRPVGQPQLLFASLTTPEKSRSLYRFKPDGQDAGWFDGNGASTVRSFMRTPVDGARISSTFGMRFHPVLHYNKMHGGTDFAAPIGTPIFAAADGDVEVASLRGSAGNETILKHADGYETVYMHQNMFMPGVTVGAHVKLGQKIGEIGTTGRSTGPHLHYEVHVNGEKVDPLSIKTDSARKALEGAALTAFLKQRDRVDVARARAAA